MVVAAAAVGGIGVRAGNPADDDGKNNKGDDHKEEHASEVVTFGSLDG